MKQVFPPEIAANSVESHFYRHNKKFNHVYVLIVLLLIIAISVLPFISIDVTTQSQGIVKTPFESNQIQSSLSGQIERINLTEGAKVSKGDTLIVLQTDQIKEQVQLLDKQRNENSAFIKDLEKLLTGSYHLKTLKYQHVSYQFNAKTEELNIDIEILQKEYMVAKQLFKEKVTPEMEFLQKKSQYEAAVSQLNVYKKQMTNNWQQDLVQIKQENRELKSNQSRLLKEMKQYTILAPISGTLIQVTGIHTGSFITPGQVLAHISPDKQLIAECYVHPKDVGLIRTGQSVRLQLDAFNYNQWGMIDAQVSSVSEDIIVIDNQPIFKVRCTLPTTFLQLKSGHKGHIKKGMTLTGRFILTERTLYQLLFDKVDDWLNPKLVKN